jgi:hypothetical protein
VSNEEEKPGYPSLGEDHSARVICFCGEVSSIISGNE